MRFGDKETGWALELEPGLVEINNIPLSDALNIGDVVKVRPAKSRPELLEVVRVVSRKYAKKTALAYGKPHGATFRALAKLLRHAHMKVEGMVDGLMLVAHGEDQDPLQIAVAAGLDVTPFSSQPSLEPIAKLS